MMRMMMLDLEAEAQTRDCFHGKLLLILDIVLASINGILATIAFSQLIRIHMRSQQNGWTRQKVLHLMIGSSNLGYFIYFISALVATCEGWLCWSNVCGFLLLAFPKILFLAAFLLLLSFWVDLCHQANDEEDDDDETSIQQTLLEKLSKPRSSSTDGHWRCCSFHGIHIGTRQKFVITVVMLVFALMISFAVIIWIGAGKNPIESSLVARVFEDFLAVTSLSLGGALGCYGLMLFLKLKKVRSEKGSSEVWKVAGLAVVSVVCFTSSASVALLTDIPLFYHWNLKKINRVKEVVLLILYYFIGCSVPSAFVLWNMRELPPPIKIQKQEQSRAIAFISHEAVATRPPQHWTSATSSKNQASRASPI
ncbi:tobamovirus multiplication protein 1 isoform X2 [Castanea sativa]|uniref:tobamovirus multiplication protein 1 isoform X2 n=1 Tax=Castanea sativa TaxID=21020 RepID=UPI003F651BAE